MSELDRRNISDQNQLNLSLFLYAYLLDHSAARHTERRLAIRLSQPVLLHHDM